jgi:integral membrane protein
MPNKTSDTPLSFRLKLLHFCALTEGISFLLLLFVAVPVKRIGGDDLLVRILGPIHGMLFLFYVLCVLLAIPILKWSAWRIGIALAASVLPFGTFVIDAQLRRERNSKSKKQF